MVNIEIINSLETKKKIFTNNRARQALIEWYFQVALISETCAIIQKDSPLIVRCKKK